MPADVKWTHCVCLTGSSQKFTSGVCGFWHHCNSFYILQVYSNRESFLDREHQKGHEETWSYCRGSLHRWLSAAHLQCCCFANKQLHSFPQITQEKLFSLTGLLEVLSGAAGQTRNKEESSRATQLGYHQCNFLTPAWKERVTTAISLQRNLTETGCAFKGVQTLIPTL